MLSIAAGFPADAIRFCLRHAGVGISDVDIVAVNSDPRAALGRKLLYTIRQRPNLGLVADRLRNAGRRQSVEAEIASTFPGTKFAGRVQRVERRPVHLASAYYCSVFERAVVVSIDGFGDFASAAWGLGEDGRITIDGRVHFPHSLGIFYQALTQHLGFPAYGDEYKVMGLAPYGKPNFMKEMREIVSTRPNGSYCLNLRYFRHHREKVAYQWSAGSPAFGPLFSSELEGLLGPAREKESALTDRHRDIAHSVQARYEEIFLELLNHLYPKYKSDAIVIAGGCGMNSVANGKIFRQTPFRHCYVQAAAGDAGGAIGAALHVRRSPLKCVGNDQMPHAYWGPEFSESEIEAVLQSNCRELTEKGCSVRKIVDTTELCGLTAAAIASGQVVGWFQGRMEWGPRALGNRSILGDPRRADMKDILNRKIKRRESFRPFAPSILRERTAEWFEEDADVPFMMQVFQVKAAQRARIPAVTHVDGSGRLQTVRRDQNSIYYDLISAFERLTGVPIVLNTSFNENEPIVCQPQEALDCFLRTRMDLLVLGPFMVHRQGI